MLDSPFFRPSPDRVPTILLYEAAVPAGFPSPADNELDQVLDLNRYLFRHPAATFLARVRGDSMLGAGIHDGDLIAVDRALPARDGHVVVAVLDGEHTVKRLSRRDGRLWLVPENDQYAPVEVGPEAQLVICGVVTHVIHGLVVKAKH